MGRLQDSVDEGQDEAEEKLTTPHGLGEKAAIRGGTRVSVEGRGGPKKGLEHVILDTIDATCSSVEGEYQRVECTELDGATEGSAGTKGLDGS